MQLRGTPGKLLAFSTAGLAICGVAYVWMAKSSSKKPKVAVWGYDKDNGPEVWNKFCEAARIGKKQSPIDLMSNTKQAKTVEDGNTQLKILYPEFFNGCNIVNNGHTVQVNIAAQNSASIVLNNKQYDLVQFHFHTPSEHQLDSALYDLEMHLVHCCKDDNSLAVLGFFFSSNAKSRPNETKLNQVKAIRGQTVDDSKTDESEKQGNAFLKQFAQQLPNKKNLANPDTLRQRFSIDYVLGTSASKASNLDYNTVKLDMDVFFYQGSLTTPPCSEGVQWLVVREQQYASKQQINQLKRCWGNHSNARPVQPYNQRVVSLFRSVTVSKPN